MVEPGALVEPLIPPRSRSSFEQCQSVRYQQHSLRLTLRNMGIDADSIEAAISVYELTELDRALFILIKTPSGWNHLFIPSDNDAEKCMICKEAFDQHTGFDPSQATPVPKSLRSSVHSEQHSFVISEASMEMGGACGVCYQEKEQYKGLGCDHEVCEDCLRDYLENQIMEAKVLDVRCPYAGCEAVLTEELIKEIVSEAWFDKFLRFKRNLQVAHMPNARWCPSPTCDHVILYGSMYKPYLRCDKCGTEMCFTCGERWHPHISCAQATDRSYEQWARGKNIQLCPQCRRRIEKETGCNHMACASCGYQWCWLCRERYSDMHFSPLNPFGCPGLQAAEHTPQRWPWYKRWILRVGILLLFPLGNFHPAILFGVPLLLTYKAMLVLDETGFPDSCTGKLIKYCCVLPIVFSLGVLFTPFVLLVSTLPLLCFLTYQGGKYLVHAVTWPQ